MRGLVVSIVATFAVCALACTLTDDLDDITGGDAAAPTPGDDDDNATASSSTSSGSKPEAGTSSSTSSSAGGSTSSSASSGSSSSTSSSSGAPTDEPIFAETFANNCNGWTLAAAGSATVTPQPETHSTGGGSCMICAVVAGEVYIERTVNAPRAGKASLSMFARRQSASGPSSATVAIRVGSSNSTVSRNIGDTFTSVAFGAASGVSVAAGAGLTARAGMAQAGIGQCLIVDDIVLTLE